MAAITIELSDTMKEFVEKQVADKQMSSPAAYLEGLLERERQRTAAREEIERLLQEALDSGPAAPMTREDWEEIRAEVHRRHAARTGSSS